MTVSAKGCIGALPTPLVAVNWIAIRVGLAEPAGGVPVSVPVPLPLSWKDAQAGRLAAFSIGNGKPVVATVNDRGTPTAMLALAALVKTAFWSMVIVTACVVRELAPLLAVMTYCAVPPVPAAGVPVMVAMPVPLSVNTSPEGSFGLIVNVVLLGVPAVVEIWMGAVIVPTAKESVVGGMMNTGGCVTVSLNVWLTLTPAVVAVKVIVNGVALAVPAGGVLVRVPVPSPLSWKDAQAGRLVAASIGCGKPVVFTVKTLAGARWRCSRRS